MLSRYLRPGTCQMPERSGWPFGLRGVGAARFALPFSRRGMFVVCRSSHCADRLVAQTTMTTAAIAIFMFDSSACLSRRHDGHTKGTNLFIPELVRDLRVHFVPS